MANRRSLTDAQLLAAISAAEATAIGSIESTTASYRADALDRYLGRDYSGSLAAPEGRSSVVSRDVADVVEGVLANVLKPFVSGDEVVQFDPLGPDDEERAEQETDYINWIALQRNNGFLTLTAAVKDALLLRAGYVKCFWTKRMDVVLETYEQLSEEEVALLLQDKDIEVVAQAQYPGAFGLVTDLKVRRTKPTEFVATKALPPEEVLVSKRQQEPGLQECDFVQHRTPLTLSELRQMGYKVEDDISDDDTLETVEDYARVREQATPSFDDDTDDAARRVVLFKESWIRIDRDGDGIAELRRVCQVGQNLLADDEADLIPIAAFCPMLMPHQHQGISVYDLIEDLAKLKTALLRQFMDNKYLSNNSRVAVNVNKVNIDDLLTSRPGGVIRAQLDLGQSVGDAIMPIVTPDTGASALQGLEYLDMVRESRSGYTRQTQGLETDALVSKTVGGMAMQLTQSQLRLEMIARTIAETGVREMFLIVHTLTLKHSTRAEKVRLKNRWVEINPREWVRRTDLSISVGLGTASQHVMMGNLALIGQAQQQVAPLGLVGPEQAYNTVRKIAIAAGFKNPDEFFVLRRGPDGQALPPPPRKPEAVMVEEVRQQGKQAEIQANMQLEQAKLQLDAARSDREHQQALLLQQSNDQRQSALDQQKAALEQANAEGERELQLQLANIKAASATEVARIGQGIDDGTAVLQQQMREAYGALMGLITAFQNDSARPPREYEVVRDANGRAQGMRPKQSPSPTMQ